MGGGPKASQEKRWVRLCWEGGEVIGTMSACHSAGDRKGSAEVCLFVLFFCLTIFMSVTHCLDCCSCVTGLRHFKYSTVPALFLSQNYFGFSGSFAFSSKF